MAEDWRVSLIFTGPPGIQQYGDAAIRARLRKRLGKHVTVSGEKPHIFLYAETADAAVDAEQVAREVLAEHSLHASFELERWDPVRGAWGDRPPDPADDADQDVPEVRRRRRRAAVAGGLAELVGRIIDSW